VARKPDNVILTAPAARALAREFLGWQCRIRQLAAREDAARPSSGMRPRVVTTDGEELSPAITTLITEHDPEASTQHFRYQYLKTHDPHERYAATLAYLQASYFQEPERFADGLTAVFGAGSPLAASILATGRCVLEFEQFTQAYRVPCAVSRLKESSPRYQVTVWQTRLFNPTLGTGLEVLAFAPDWAHAKGWRRETGA
jgi:hypothetical protein